MEIDIKTVFLIGIGAAVVTMYYLEREMERVQIFWMWGALGVIFGIASVYTVSKDIETYKYYIIFSVLSILLAIMYYDTGEDVEETKKVKKNAPKKGTETKGTKDTKTKRIGTKKTIPKKEKT